MKKSYLMMILLVTACKVNEDQVYTINNFIKECDITVEYVAMSNLSTPFKSTHGMKCGNKILSFSGTLHILPDEKGI